MYMITFAIDLMIANLKTKNFTRHYLLAEK